MIAHIMQALIVFILIAFPFAINFDDITLDNHSLNSTAVVDSAIVKHYSQTGSLPERLDAETLKKLGLNDEAIKGMTYEKLEDRKFVLTYADSRNEVKESIHSNTQLPVNVNTNFGEAESKEDNYWLELPESPNQTVTVEIKFPDGSTAVLNEGERKQYPANSEFNVVVVPDKGFGPGKGLPSNGKLNKDITLEVTKAERSMIKVTVANNYKKPLEGDGFDVIAKYSLFYYISPEGEKGKFSIENGNEIFIPYGSHISASRDIEPPSVIYKMTYSPFQEALYDDTIFYVDIERTGYIVNVDNAPNQTIKVTVGAFDKLPWSHLYRPIEDNSSSSTNPSPDPEPHISQFQIWNGESCIVPNDGCEIVKVEVVADAGYKPGTPSITSCPITGDMTVTATPAVKEEPPAPPEEDIGDGWVPLRPLMFAPGTPQHGKPLKEVNPELWLAYEVGVGYNWTKFYYMGNNYLMIKTPKDISKIVFSFDGLSTPEDNFGIIVKHPSYAPYDGTPRYEHSNYWFGYKTAYKGFYEDRGPNGPEQKNYEYFGYPNQPSRKYFSSLPGDFTGCSFWYGMIEVKPDTYYIIKLTAQEWQYDYCGFYYNRKYQHLEAPVVDLLDDVPDYQKP